MSRTTPARQSRIALLSSAQAATLQAAAVPYGFTLSFGSSLALAIRDHGPPGFAEAMLLVAGTVAAFTLLMAIAASATSAFGPHSAPHDDAQPTPPLAMALIVGPGTAVCACAAIGMSWTVGRLVGGEAAWAAGGCAVTLVYFGLAGLARAQLRPGGRLR